jgi:hypothetical protein
MTDLASHICQICLIDIHEHLNSEQQFLEEGLICFKTCSTTISQWT